MIYNDTVWNLQVLAPGSSSIGESKLTLQFYMSIQNGKPRFQRGFLPAYSYGCWKLVLAVEKTWPRLSVSLSFKDCLLNVKVYKPLEGTLCTGEEGYGSRDGNCFLSCVFCLTA